MILDNVPQGPPNASSEEKIEGRSGGMNRSWRAILLHSPSVRTIETEADIAEGVEQLIALEPRFGGILELTGHPPLRRVQGGFAALGSIVTEQMLSLHAANAIWKRTLERIDPFEPARVLEASDEDFRAAGQSMAKARTMRAVAQAVVDGAIYFDALVDLDDDDVHAQLTSIKGIGPWTAQIYMLTCLGRPDVWPAGDVALQSAAQSAFDLDERPVGKTMIALAEPWRPWRSIAARCLWAHYRHTKALAPES